MIWFLAVHIMAMLIWCASLLFLLSLTVARCPSRQAPNDALTPRQHNSVVRQLLTLISTPAAVVAIISGTWVFLLQGSVDSWLIAKLTLVVLLVVCHTTGGVLILRTENEKKTRPWGQILATVSAVLMLAIVWLVLAKPGQGELLWI